MRYERLAHPRPNKHKTPKATYFIIKNQTPRTRNPLQHLSVFPIVILFRILIVSQANVSCLPTSVLRQPSTLHSQLLLSVLCALCGEHDSNLAFQHLLIKQLHHHIAQQNKTYCLNNFIILHLCPFSKCSNHIFPACIHTEMHTPQS